MRKYMTKEVTSTEIKLAQLVINEEGLPIANVIPSHVVLGELTKEKAQKLISKKFPSGGVTIYAMETKTNTYKMEVSKFIKVAELVKGDEDLNEETDEETDEETESDESNEAPTNNEPAQEPTPEPTPEEEPKPKSRRITANTK
jgi:Ran GTPase-activating protein (RanGAP) involved in mRNA processing and transport